MVSDIHMNGRCWFSSLEYQYTLLSYRCEYRQQSLVMKNEGSFLTIHEGFTPKDTDSSGCRIIPIFKVDDIGATQAKLKAHGVSLQGEITETPVHHFQMLKDFDGNWIEVAQFKN